MGGSITIKDKKKGERFVKSLKKGQTRAKVDAETGIPGAMKIIEKLEKRIKDLEKANTSLSTTVGLLWKWKIETEMKTEEDE